MRARRLSSRLLLVLLLPLIACTIVAAEDEDAANTDGNTADTVDATQPPAGPSLEDVVPLTIGAEYKSDNTGSRDPSFVSNHPLKEDYDVVMTIQPYDICGVMRLCLNNGRVCAADTLLEIRPMKQEIEVKGIGKKYLREPYLFLEYESKTDSAFVYKTVLWNTFTKQPEEDYPTKDLETVQIQLPIGGVNVFTSNPNCVVGIELVGEPTSDRRHRAYVYSKEPLLEEDAEGSQSREKRDATVSRTVKSTKCSVVLDGDVIPSEAGGDHKCPTIYDYDGFSNLKSWNEEPEVSIFKYTFNYKRDERDKDVASDRFENSFIVEHEVDGCDWVRICFDENCDAELALLYAAHLYVPTFPSRAHLFGVPPKQLGSIRIIVYKDQVHMEYGFVSQSSGVNRARMPINDKGTGTIFLIRSQNCKARIAQDHEYGDVHAATGRSKGDNDPPKAVKIASRNLEKCEPYKSKKSSNQ